MKLTRDNPDRLKESTRHVLALNNNYSKPAQVARDLEKWTNVTAPYNTINHPTYLLEDFVTKVKTRHEIEYGYARLDAFGRIYNRVIQHAINRDQVASELALVTDVTGKNAY